MVSKSICMLDNELLTVSLLPFNLSCDVPKLFYTMVYVHLLANASATAQQLRADIIQRLGDASPDVLEKTPESLLNGM